mmetsp:Transcript_19024/g.61976  ORF Transcript_19024/g.61976 Transcript_19024/m.61976 type:complete len:204 (+) Transcript_19024:59-670(+)
MATCETEARCLLQGEEVPASVDNQNSQGRAPSDAEGVSNNMAAPASSQVVRFMLRPVARRWCALPKGVRASPHCWHSKHGGHHSAPPGMRSGDLPRCEPILLGTPLFVVRPQHPRDCRITPIRQNSGLQQRPPEVADQEEASAGGHQRGLPRSSALCASPSACCSSMVCSPTRCWVISSSLALGARRTPFSSMRDVVRRSSSL